MKGHAKIELIEVATGKKKVVEHDNMLTKAISEYVKPIALTGYTPLLDCKTKDNSTFCSVDFFCLMEQ